MGPSSPAVQYSAVQYSTVSPSLSSQYLSHPRPDHVACRVPGDSTQDAGVVVAAYEGVTINSFYTIPTLYLQYLV